jgi:hypothetical protein
MHENSIAYDLAMLLESEGIGRFSEDLFTVDEPEGELDWKFYILLQESPVNGTLDRVLLGTVSMETQFLVVNVVSTTETDGRDTMNRINKVLENVCNWDVGNGTRYMNAIAIAPIHLLGCDRARRYVHEQVFRVQRKE